MSEGQFNTYAVENNSARVRRLLCELCPTVVANAEALSSNVRFFAASAFGHTPVKLGPGEYVPDPSKLSPIDVEVPLVWILSQIRISLIPSRPSPSKSA